MKACGKPGLAYAACGTPEPHAETGEVESNCQSRRRWREASWDERVKAIEESIQNLQSDIIARLDTLERIFVLIDWSKLQIAIDAINPKIKVEESVEDMFAGQQAQSSGILDCSWNYTDIIVLQVKHAEFYQKFYGRGETHVD